MRGHKSIGLLFFVLAFLVVFSGCRDGGGFGWNIEGTGPPPDPPDDPYDPFDPEPLIPTPPPGGGGDVGGGGGRDDGGGDDPTTVHKTDTFTQAHVGKVDIVWMIDTSGSMANNQDELSDNAQLFTDKLLEADVDFKLIILTTDPGNPLPTYPNDAARRALCQGTVITRDNADLFETCAIVGTRGSGLEEGLEAVRRALDPDYPRGPWSSGATPAPLLPGFLRDGSDLHIAYVSDEEDQGDARAPASNTWRAPLIALKQAEGASPEDAEAWATAQIEAFRNEMPTDPVVAIPGRPTTGLADGGRLYDNKYAFFPRVAAHVDFLSGLKADSEKVRAHAVTIVRLDGSDACHTRQITEEIGKRYRAFADLMGGSKSNLCESWEPTMNELGLQASGLDKCFQLSENPIPETITVAVDDEAVTDFEYSAFGRKVCLGEFPPPGSEIAISYEHY